MPCSLQSFCLRMNCQTLPEVFMKKPQIAPKGCPFRKTSSIRLSFYFFKATQLRPIGVHYESYLSARYIRLPTETRMLTPRSEMRVIGPASASCFLLSLGSTYRMSRCWR